MAETVESNGHNLKFEKVLWISVISATVAIPFLMTLVGLVHIDDCPHQPHIPVIVLLAGVSMSVSNVINTADKYSPPKQTSYKKRKHIIQTLNVIINCFSIASIVTGGVWVYGDGKPSYNKSNPDYCNPTLFLFVFWLMNISLAFMSLLIIAVIIGFIIKYIKKS